MDKNQALQLLLNAISSMRLTLQEHQTLQKALAVVSGAEKESENVKRSGGPNGKGGLAIDKRGNEPVPTGNS